MVVVQTPAGTAWTTGQGTLEDSDSVAAAAAPNEAATLITAEPASCAA